MSISSVATDTIRVLVKTGSLGCSPGVELTTHRHVVHRPAVTRPGKVTGAATPADPAAQAAHEAPPHLRKKNTVTAPKSTRGSGVTTSYPPL